MSAALQALVGQTLAGAYRLESILGVGGMGAVYRAVQLNVDRQVAVKVLRPSTMQDADPEQVEQMKARFRREATLTAKLKHPHTVQLIDFGTTDDGMLYLVLEFLEGQELSRAMRAVQGRGLEPARVAQIGYQICLSLAEAHERGLVHRDLKPDNIFLADYHGAQDHVKVMDFGIARVIDNEDQTSELTAAGTIIGTPRYMAPEQVEAKPLTAQSDLYSLGVILYEMLVGEALFTAPTALSLAYKHVNEAPAPLDEQRFGSQWAVLMEMLLAKKPQRRPPSAAALAVRLQSLYVSSGGVGAAGTAPFTVPSSEQTMTAKSGGHRAAGRSKGLMAALAVLVLGGVGGLVAVVAGGDSSPPQPASKASLSEVDRPSKSAAEKPKQAAVKAPAATEVKPTKVEVAPKVVTPPSGVTPEPAKQVKLPPTQLKLATTPTGTAVSRGGKRLCTTPCDAALKGAGETVLTVQAPGYKERLITVALKLGSTVDRELVLEKLPTPAPVIAAPLPTKAASTSKKRKKRPRKTKKKKATSLEDGR